MMMRKERDVFFEWGLTTKHYHEFTVFSRGARFVKKRYSSILPLETLKSYTFPDPLFSGRRDYRTMPRGLRSFEWKHLNWLKRYKEKEVTSKTMTGTSGLAYRTRFTSITFPLKERVLIDFLKNYEKDTILERTELTGVTNHFVDLTRKIQDIIDITVDSPVLNRRERVVKNFIHTGEKGREIMSNVISKRKEPIRIP